MSEMDTSRTKLIRKEGFDLKFDPDACRQCEGRCCNGESGNIYVNRKEIETISRFLNMEPATFVEDFLRKVSYKLSIKEVKANQNYACVFFDKEKNKCAIYPVRPDQCKTFPFWDYYKDKPEALSRECPGVSFK